MTKPITTIPGDTALCRQDGFALVTAIMMLFVAMILGLMVVDSADMEILLSGAQQRYEDNLNTIEGSAAVEAAAVGTGKPITRNGISRTYALVNPLIQNQVLSPSGSNDPLFDPGGDMPSKGNYTVDARTPPGPPGIPPEQWPMDNLVQSVVPAGNLFDYHYRVVYLHDDAPRKGDDAGKYAGYLFEISAQRDTLVQMGGIKSGPKLND